MAAQAKCKACGAAFVFANQDGYPDCPHCGATMVRTTYDYKGAWFSVNGAKHAVKVPYTVFPVGLPAFTSTVEGREKYYRFVATKQDQERAARDLRYSENTYASSQKPGSYFSYKIENLEESRAKFEKATKRAAKAAKVWDAVAA